MTSFKLRTQKWEQLISFSFSSITTYFLSQLTLATIYYVLPLAKVQDTKSTMHTYVYRNSTESFFKTSIKHIFAYYSSKLYTKKKKYQHLCISNLSFCYY